MKRVDFITKNSGGGYEYSEIKPCPFCGSLEIQIDKCTMRARCKNCFATGGLIARLVKDSKSENAAVEAWNRRAYAEDN